MSASAYQGECEEERKALLHQNLENFVHQNSEQRDYLFEIETKLHSILDRRIPDEACKEKSLTLVKEDFISLFNREVSCLTNQPIRLKKIYDHLKELI